MMKRFKLIAGPLLVLAFGVGLAARAPDASAVACGSAASPVGWWQAEGDYEDSAGTNDGTAVGAVGFGAGQCSQAFSHAGSPGYVSLGSGASLNPASAISISAWINPTSLPAGDLMAVVTKWTQNFTFAPHLDTFGLWLMPNGRVFTALHFTSAVNGEIEPHIEGGSVPTGTWTHVAMTYDAFSGTFVLYVNGVSQATGSYPGGTIVTSSADVQIGHEDSPSVRQFAGRIDEVQIYDRALSWSEVADLAGIALCGPGHFSATGVEPCTPALPGTYVNTIGATSATSCPLGTFSPVAGAAACDLAPPGYYVDSVGSASATACPGGTYNSLVGSASAAACVQTPPGTYAPAGSAAAIQCPGGTYNALSGQDSPDDCLAAPPGTYAPAGSTAAIQCPGGTYNALAGQDAPDDCLAAPPGTYAPAGSSAAIACPVGTFSATAGAAACTLAPPGTYVDVIGATAPTACPAGTTSPAGSDSSADCVPVDADGDGVPDSGDRCPSLPGPASRHGCPDACSVAPTILGTTGNDHIVGTPGDDVIWALTGNDHVDGNGGNDLICAGDGNDHVVTHGGNDVINLGDGNDHVQSGGGSDIVDAGDGNDRIISGDGNDLVDAGDGNDHITAGGGDDRIIAGLGNDRVEGGSGYDVCSGGAGNNRIIGCEG